MQILIIDLGSQYTRVISRVLCELGVRSIILSPEKAKTFNLSNIKGIILSGGDKSVSDIDAPTPPLHIFHDDYRHIPILGICYGMQYIAQYYDYRSVTTDKVNKNYGECFVVFEDDPLTKGTTGLHTDSVWVSYSDSVTNTPDEFKTIARFDDPTLYGRLGIAGISNVKQKIWGIQFHPEVTHTRNGKRLLSNFLFNICQCETDWKPIDIINDIREQARRAIGNDRCILGFSGGVDSTTLARILCLPLSWSGGLGENLTAVTINTGALRENELDEIQDHAAATGVHHIIIEAADAFQQQMRHVIDAQHKRNNFKQEYKRVLEDYAKRVGAKYILQGSIAPDMIESGATGKAALIKSHHNVGHEWNGLIEIPLMVNLFKYEVRELAKSLNLPESAVNRQPFPGPGLFLRVLGAPANPINVNIVRDADAVVTNILKDEGVYNKISQLVVALACINTVGIKGDARTYGPAIIIRAVETQDYMTVKGFQIPAGVRRRIASEVSKHPDISRVWFDEMDKPPATVEFE